MLTRNEEIQHETRLAAQFVARGFNPAWRNLSAQDDNPNEFDWAAWKRRLVILLLALLMESAEGLATDEGLDAALLLALYEQEGKQRLAQIAETTERNVRAEYARYQAGDISLAVYRANARKWFSPDRAATIADYEFGKLSAAAALEHMRKLNVYHWEWVHQGDDIPCAVFCRDNVGKIFSLHDPMPPVHPSDHCRAKPIATPV